jgi:hypothetical protein
VVLIAVSRKGGSGDSTNLSVPLSISAALCAAAGLPKVVIASIAKDKITLLNTFELLVTISNPLFNSVALEEKSCFLLSSGSDFQCDYES